MKPHSKKIQDQDPHQVEDPKEFTLTFCWAVFSNVTGLLALHAQSTGEESWSILLISLCALAALFTIRGIISGKVF